MSTPHAPQPPRPGEDLERDLGFGAVVARESRQRFLNRDGSFNVVREGLGAFESLNLYHHLLTISWPAFLGLLAAGYLAANLVFGAAYIALGPGAIGGGTDVSTLGRFLTCFFFSVETMATIGYGHLVPQSLGANLVMTGEAMLGLLGIALTTGMTFARFSRPTTRLLFSERAVIAPFRGGTAFMFRLANARSSQLIEVRARVTLARRKPDGGRDFVELPLERPGVLFFPLSWTVVHPIDEQSPLWGMDERALHAADAEFLILLSGTDETFAQTLHTRTSYKSDEVVWGARFANVFNPATAEGRMSIDLARLSRIEPAELPR